MDFRKHLPFQSYGVKKPTANELATTHRERFVHTFGTNETQQLFERQLVGGMLLQTLATAASGQRQAMLNAR